MMKKLSVLLLMMMGAVAFAEVTMTTGTTTYYQFSHDGTAQLINYSTWPPQYNERGGDIKDYLRVNNGPWDPEKPNQNWDSSQMQVLHVKAGTTVWISNFAKNWESNNDTIHDLGDLNYSGNKGLNMAKDMYGYMDAEVVGKTGEVYEPVIPVDSIRHGGTGEKATVTFTNTATNQSVHTEAYKLGSFTEDKDIFLYVTLPDGRYGDSYAMIDNNGKLGSRMDNEYDVAGNTRFNWQFRGGNGYQGYEIEFIAFYSVNEEPHEPVGQPLPGVFFSSIVGLGSIVAARLRKRDRRK